MDDKDKKIIALEAENKLLKDILAGRVGVKMDEPDRRYVPTSPLSPPWIVTSSTSYGSRREAVITSHGGSVLPYYYDPGGHEVAN